MRVVAAAVVLSVAAFHCALSASLEGAEKPEKPEKDVQYDGLKKLQERDQEEFEAAHKEESPKTNEPEQFEAEAAQKEDVIVVNVTVEDEEDDGTDGCVEQQKEPADANTERAGNAEAAATREEDHRVGNAEAAATREEDQREAESRSSEEMKEHNEAVTESASSSEEETQDSSKEKGNSSAK